MKKPITPLFVALPSFFAVSPRSGDRFRALQPVTLAEEIWLSPWDLICSDFTVKAGEILEFVRGDGNCLYCVFGSESGKEKRFPNACMERTISVP